MTTTSAPPAARDERSRRRLLWIEFLVCMAGPVVFGLGPMALLMLEHPTAIAGLFALAGVLGFAGAAQCLRADLRDAHWTPAEGQAVAWGFLLVVGLVPLAIIAGLLVPGLAYGSDQTMLLLLTYVLGIVHGVRRLVWLVRRARRVT